MERNHFDLLVIGAGIAGLTAAAAGLAAGRRVAIANTGLGQFVFGAGCIESQRLRGNEAPDMAEEAIGFFQEITRQAGCPFHGGLDQRRYLPTIMGSFQAVALAPFYLWNADAAQNGRAAVIGLAGLTGFDAAFTASRLDSAARQQGFSARYQAREIALPLPAGAVPAPLHYANCFDRDPAFRAELLEKLRPIAREVPLLILPGLLGVRSRLPEISAFENELGARIAELPTLPPSVPGLRLARALKSHLRRQGAEVFSGFPVREILMNGQRAEAVVIDSPARPLTLKAEAIVLASGQFSGPLLGSRFFGIDGHLRPIAADGAVIGENLHAAGALLRALGGAGGNERAILTGYRAGMLAAGREERYAAQ